MKKLRKVLPVKEGQFIHERHHFGQRTVHELGYFSRCTAYRAKGKKAENFSEVRS